MNLTVKLLEETLYTCAKQAFTKIIEKLSDEKIYCLALYTAGGLEYLTTTCSTYQGLERVAKKYKQKEHYAGISLEQLQNWLKWSPCDSPHHLAFKEEMKNVDKLMYQLSEKSYELYSNDEHEASESLDQEIVDAIIRVLQKLDKEGVFGNDRVREGIVVNLLKGDQSDEERFYFAKQLNPQSVFQ